MVLDFRIVAVELAFFFISLTLQVKELLHYMLQNLHGTAVFIHWVIQGALMSTLLWDNSPTRLSVYTHHRS